MFARRLRDLALALALCLTLLSWPATPAAAQAGPPQCASGYALWANGQGRDETLDLSGSSVTVSGATRSNADLRISGSNNTLEGRVEYVSTFQDGGDQNRYPTPTQVAAATPPVSYDIAAYRPGGAAATAAQAAGRYTAINGDLDVSEPRTLSGLYYVSGDAKLSASNITGSFTVVAEGAIDVSGSQLRATPYADGLLLFSSKAERGAAVIKLAGSDSDLRGVIAGPGGTVELSGSNSRYAGLILGDALKLNGSNLRISFAGEYCPGGSTTPPPGEEQRPAEPPARIVIGDDAVTRRVEVVGGVTLITIQITIRNSGGRAGNTRLVIELPGRGDDDDDDDDRFELSEVRFVAGAGYVRERSGRRVVIGVGENNVLRGRNPATVSVTYRLRDGARDDDDDGRITFDAVARLIYSDSGGTRTVELPSLVVVVPVVVVAPAPPRATGDVPRLPVERIDVRFRSVWVGRGGLAIFGLPLSEARTLGDGTVVQLFERARLELRPGVSAVQLGLIAVELGYGRPGGPAPDDDDDRRWHYPATGHTIAAPFRGYWAERGALVVFGLPITGLYSDDAGRQSQCFERACMQLFPELSSTPSAIQLRLLGVELLTRGDDDDD